MDTVTGRFYCCKCKFIYMDNSLETGSLEVLEKLSSIAGRFHLKLLDRLIILQQLEKLVREKKDLPFIRIVENFNQINCFNASIQSLEQCVKLQILGTLHSVLGQKMKALSDLTKFHEFVFLAGTDDPVENNPEPGKTPDAQATSPEVPNLGQPNSSEINGENKAPSLRAQNLQKMLNSRISELETLLHQFRKIDPQSLGKEAPSYLRADVAGLEWLCEFFQKLSELVQTSQAQRVSFSFSFNEMWQFLANRPSFSEAIQVKIGQFTRFFTGCPDLSNFRNCEVVFKDHPKRTRRDSRVFRRGNNFETDGSRQTKRADFGVFAFVSKAHES